MSLQKDKIITRLTALWAISESGLGGFMHALKIPFTGFFLGGFAIVIITLIAHNSQSKWKAVMQATFIVMIIKAAVSPQSPPTAYLAVAFQGLAGALVYSLFLVTKFSGAFFGMIALAESAMQKLIVMTLIFGKTIWEALDAFFQSISKDLHIDNPVSFSFWIIALYVGAHVLWGGILGIWAVDLPKKLEAKAAEISTNIITTNDAGTQKKSPAKRKNKLLFLVFTLVFIISVFIFQGSMNRAVYAIFRTIAALLILYFIINPIVKWALNQWLQKQGAKKQTAINAVLDVVPELKSYLNPAMRIARRNHKGISVYAAFVVNWIVLSLYHRL